MKAAGIDDHSARHGTSFCLCRVCLPAIGNDNDDGTEWEGICCHARLTDDPCLKTATYTSISYEGHDLDNEWVACKKHRHEHDELMPPRTP